MLPSDIRGLYESYQSIYQQKEEDEISSEMIEEIVEELVEECLELGYTLDEATEVVQEAAELYFDIQELEEAKVTYGSDTESPEERTARAKERLGSRKSEARKAAVKGAVKRVGEKLGGARAAAGIAGSIAKDEAKRAGRRAQHEVGKAASAVGSAVTGAAKAAYGAAKEKKAEVKKGVKSLIGRGLRKVAGVAGTVAQKARKAGAAAGKAAERLGEETITEDPVQDYRDMQRAKQNAASGGSAAQNLQPRSREFEKVLPSGGKPKPSPGSGTITRPTGPSSPGYDTRRLGGSDLRRLSNSYEPEGKSVEEGLLDIGRSAAETAGGVIGANKGRQTGIPGAGKVGEVLGRQRGGQMYDKVTEPLKGRIPGFNKGGTVKKEEVEIVDENIQAVVKTGLDKASNFMKTNPVGKAASAVLAPVGPGRKTPTATSGGYRKEQFDTIDENVGGSVKLKPGSGLGGGTPVYPKGQEPKPTGAKLPTLQNAHYEPEDIYDLVMEYLLDNGHADTVSEAHYIMSQLDENAIENIFEETTTQKLARRASEKADEPGAKTQYKPEGPGFKHPRSKASIMNQIASRAKNRSQNGVDSQYASQSEQPRRGGRSGRGSKTDRPGTANMPNPNRKPKG